MDMLEKPIDNPFENITSADLEKHAGKVIAVINKQIVASETSRDALEELMRSGYPDQEYASLCLPR